MIPELGRRALSFAAIGGIATLVHYAILVLLVETQGVSALPASSAGFICSALLNYSLNYHVTFRSTRRHATTAPKFLLIASIGLAFNSAIVSAGTVGLGWNYLLVQVVATVVVLLWNFAANSAWTFGRPDKG